MSTQSDVGVQVEAPILSLRRQGRVLTLPVLLLIVLAAASGYFVGALPQSWMNWAAGLGALAVALLFGIGPVLGWLANRVTLTDRRVIVRRGFFVHRRSEIPLSRVREVRSRRGPLQRMFGSGDIELMVGPDSAPVLLRDVSAPGVVVDALQQLIEQNFRAEQSAQPAQHWPAVPGSVGGPQPMPGWAAPGSSPVHGDTTLLP